ncbi:hypothetical protein N665_0080s0006 [Sinapis alba]|nr:hypothetical protein N665_0080s0006 [Sinapis alba]
MGSRPLYAWRSIQFGKELLIQGLRKQLGNGRTISMWVDDWIEGNVRRRPLMKNIFVDVLLKVSDLIDFHNKCWKLSVLQELFYEEDIRRILAMKTVFEEEITGYGFTTEMEITLSGRNIGFKTECKRGGDRRS